MKLKIDQSGNAVLQDGKPVYIKDDNTEIVFDAETAFAKIGQLQGEAKSYRMRSEEAAGKLSAFEGIADPEAARKALDTVAALEQKKLIDAGEVEKVKAEVAKAYQAQIDAAQAQSSKLEKQLYAEMIGGSFARSKFVQERLAIPADLVQAAFGGRFAIEDGRIVASDANGNKLYSATSPGDLAGFEEAIEMLVHQYPGKEHILKGTGASGGGASGGKPGGAGAKTMARSQFEALDPAGRAAAIKSGATITEG